MDDECYFTLTNTNIASNNIYYTSNSSTTPSDIKFKTKAKFEEKILVYIVMSSKGISKPVMFPSGLAINQQKYLSECIQKRLIPFIEAYHKNDQVVFWPDLARTHYAKTVVDYIESKNVQMVAKEDNPANVPECRPIEDFWRDLKQLVYNKNWQAENTEQLRRRIEYCLKKVDMTRVQSQMESIKFRLDLVRRFGVVETRQ